MREYLYKMVVPDGVSFKVPVPVDGGLYGVYSPGASLNISWIYNGIKAAIKTGASEWEPLNGFNPRPTSYVEVENIGNTAVEVSVRMYANGE